LMFPIPVCLAAASAVFAATGNAPWALALGAAGVAARLCLHVLRRSRFPTGNGGLALVPVRDVLSLAVWAFGLFQRRVTWRGARLAVEARGALKDGGRS